jgi:hypothetical protein
MTGVPFSLDPNKPCAHYTNYKADVVFTNGGNPVNATITSGITPPVWNEGPGGTYPFVGPLVNNCPKYPYSSPQPSAVGGFLVTLTGGVTCAATPATYLRNDVNITVTLQGVGACSGTLSYSLVYYTTANPIPPFFDAGDHVAACAPIIAPAACLIGAPLN